MVNSVFRKIFKNKTRIISLVLVLGSLLLAAIAGSKIEQKHYLTLQSLDVHYDNQEKEKLLYYIVKSKKQYLPEHIPLVSEKQINSKAELEQIYLKVNVHSENVYLRLKTPKNSFEYKKLIRSQHFGLWSLLPAVLAILLSWLNREPLTALLAGIIAGAFLMGNYDFINRAILPSLATESAAGVLLLYLILLGALMGIWSRTGAAVAFAEMATQKWVKGPRSAKLVAWGLGALFFQGGSISAVLTGTTVKPVADKEKISHEELSYIVDSTSSPIAILLAFNAWPGYIQSFIYVSGAAFLATEADRLSFFFKSLPLSFYAWFAVAGTFLLSLDKKFFIGKKMKAAIERARNTGELDAKDANPLSAKELEKAHIPDGYKSHISDFFIPLLTLTLIALITFFITGSPEIRIAFAAAVLVAALMAMARGMSLHDLVVGITEGMKGVTLGAVILLMAITIGNISQQVGAGTFLVEHLQDTIPYFWLPIILMLLSMLIAFSTGTSWGTFAVTFPLAMPLAFAVGQASGLANIELYMMINFATVLNGSVYGDQCSPISDTTVLSSMSTGADLMDHVKTQIIPASWAALFAAIGWFSLTIIAV